MDKVALGNTGIKVSPVGLGTWEMSGDVWGSKDDETSKSALIAGIDCGANFIDTAAVYGAGRVETLLGELLADHAIKREEVVISTKVKPQDGTYAPPPEVAIDDAFSPDWITEQVEQSLARLHTNYIDILFMHTWSKAWDHEAAWHQCLCGLRARGKIRAIGISVPDEGAADANTHIEAGRVNVIQVVYSAFQQEPEYTLFPLAAKHGVGIVARSPFSSGALVQQWSEGMNFPKGDWRGSWPLKVKPGWLEDQVRMAGVVKPLLAKAHIGFAAAALRFVLDNPNVHTVIPGSANPDHVKENLSSIQAPALDPQLRQQLKELWLSRRICGTYNGSI